MADLTDAELDALEECAESAGLVFCYIHEFDDAVLRSLIAEVRRWRDQAADDSQTWTKTGPVTETVGAGLRVRSTSGASAKRLRELLDARSVGSPGAAHAPEGDGDE